MRVISGHLRPACAPPGVPIPWREVINPTMPPLDIRHDQVPPSWSARPHTPSSNICDTSHHASCPHQHGTESQEWTNTCRTTVRATRLRVIHPATCSSHTHGIPKSHTRANFDVRPALNSQATIYANHIPRRTPVSVAIPPLYMYCMSRGRLAGAEKGVGWRV
jgi:hypothetical protein